jgi:hypothetical protein
MATYYASASNGRAIELIRVTKADQSVSVRHEIVALFPLTKAGQLKCEAACERRNLDLLLGQGQ